MSQLLDPAIARGKSSQTIPLLIKAGQSERVRATGSTFYLTEAPARVEIRADNLAASEYAAGTGMDCDGDAFFEVLEVRNPHAVDIEVKIYVGFAKYRDQRAAVIEPPSVINSLFEGDLAANGEVAVSGSVSGGLIRRKAVLVYNGSLEVRLYVLTPAGKILGFVPPGQGHTFPTSGPLVVKNRTGAAVETYVSEIVWAQA